MTEKAQDIFVVIRSVGERTEELCKKLILDQGADKEHVMIVRETPFSESLRKSFQAGINSRKKMTLCIDADVLLRKGSIAAAVTLFEKQNLNVCELRGFVLDKFFGGPREAGFHLYRTSLLEKAVEMIPDRNCLRPESETLNAMKNEGFPSVKVPVLLGIHDFEQYYSDIFRKCFIQAHKHLYRSELLISNLRSGMGNDPDHKIGLHGFTAGIYYNDEVRIDARQEVYQKEFEALQLTEKQDLNTDEFDFDRIETIIKSFKEPEVFKKYLKYTVQDLENINAFTRPKGNAKLNAPFENVPSSPSEPKNMKVAFCITGLLKYVGGAERSLSELANELTNRGYEVVIINREKKRKDTDKIFYPLNDQVKLSTFYANKQSEGLPDRSYRTFVDNRFFYLGYNPIDVTIRVLNISLVINVDVLYQIKAKLFGQKKTEKQPREDEEQKQLKAWLSSNSKEIALWRDQLVQHKPDAVVSFMNHVYILTDRALQGLNIPHITANRNDPFKKPLYSNPVLKKLIYRAVENARFNLIQVEAFRSYFLPQHHDKTVVIPSPVDMRGALNSEPARKKKVILCVGSYRAQKNHRLLIKSFFKICHKYPDWTVEIYGENLGLKEELYDLVESLNLEKKVKLRAPEKDIHKQYQKAAVFAIPSLYEGFSRALGEAMAHGLPCLAIEDCISNKELIENGKCGLIATNTPDDFAEKLAFLIQHSDKRTEWGENGRAYAREFTPERIYNVWDQLLLSVQKSHAKNHPKQHGSPALKEQ